MKQSLSIKLGQQLKMTPQLQQAIRLLQLSTLELEQEIQDSIDANPMLETEDDWADSPDNESADAQDDFSDGEVPLEVGDFAAEHNDGDPGDDFNDDLAAADRDLADLPDNYGEEMISNDVAMEGIGESEVSDQLHEPLADDIPVDSNWDDIYPQTPSGASGDSDYDAGANDSAEETLESHLLWQLNLTHMAESDRIIAFAIIDAITDDGLLGISINDICATLAQNHQGADAPPTEDEVCEILQRIQRFDPVGVGARDLRECLLIQLDQLDEATPWLKEAKLLVDQFLALLGSKDFAALVRQTQLTEHELSQVVALIRTLQPRPGAALLLDRADYEVPDVLVRKEKGRWWSNSTPRRCPKYGLTAPMLA